MAGPLRANDDSLVSNPRTQGTRRAAATRVGRAADLGDLHVDLYPGGGAPGSLVGNVLSDPKNREHHDRLGTWHVSTVRPRLVG